jgi:aspartyl-tRNA(Asn)/glutamyl-tRNA(Gln) amidotransferase subunit A
MEPVGREPDLQTVRTMRMAYSPTLGFAKVDAPVERIVASAIDRLRPFFPSLETVIEVCPDPSDIHRTLFLGGMSARLGDLITTSADLIDPPLLAAVKRFREMSVDTHTRLARKQFEFRETLEQFFERYDILLTPATECVAWDVEQALPPSGNIHSFLRPFNLTGQPAASIPCGLTPDRLPVALQVVVPSGSEAQLIAALRIIEVALGGPTATPIEIAKR